MKKIIITCALSCTFLALAHAQTPAANPAPETTQAPTTTASDLLSSGSATGWGDGKSDATAPALAQASNLVTSAQGTEFTDDSKRIKLNLPSAWEARSIKPENAKSVVSNFVLEGPGAPPPTCVVTAVKSANTAKLSQTKINEVMHSANAVAGIKKAIGGSGAKLVSTKKIKMDEISAIEVIIQPKMPKKAPDLTTMLVVSEQPGVRWQVACSAYTSEFEQIKPEYDTVVQSVRWVK